MHEDEAPPTLSQAPPPKGGQNAKRCHLKPVS